jgi:hypothetical protein
MVTVRQKQILLKVKLMNLVKQMQRLKRKVKEMLSLMHLVIGRLRQMQMDWLMQTVTLMQKQMHLVIGKQS